MSCASTVVAIAMLSTSAQAEFTCASVQCSNNCVWIMKTAGKAAATQAQVDAGINCGWDQTSAQCIKDAWTSNPAELNQMAQTNLPGPGCGLEDSTTQAPPPGPAPSTPVPTPAPGTNADCLGDTVYELPAGFDTKGVKALVNDRVCGSPAATQTATTVAECAQQCLEHVSCMCVSWNGPDSTHKDLNCNFHCSTEGEQAPGAMSLPERFVRSLPIPRGCLPALPRTHRCAESCPPLPPPTTTTR